MKNERDTERKSREQEMRAKVPKLAPWPTHLQTAIRCLIPGIATRAPRGLCSRVRSVRGCANERCAAQALQTSVTLQPSAALQSSAMRAPGRAGVCATLQ
jgi:hypothetical protein